MRVLRGTDDGLCTSIRQPQPFGSAQVLHSIRREATRTVERLLDLNESVAFALTSANDEIGELLPPEEGRVFRPRACIRKCEEWGAGRRAAHLALRQLGLENSTPVLRGDGGEPIWPEGFAGSITHCYPWSFAMVARTTALLGVGIDLESQLRMGKVDISNVVCRKAELDWIFADGDFQERVIMIFSAKEAIYKALYPVYRRYIDFQEVELSWIPEESRFVVRFAAPFDQRPLLDRVCNVHCWRQENFVFSCSTLQTL